jgi:hypothetical protein
MNPINLNFAKTTIATLGKEAKAIEARYLPTGIFSTKFLILAASLIAGILIMHAEGGAMLSLIKWTVAWYCATRMVETNVHMVCTTYLQGKAMDHGMAAAQALDLTAANS